MADDAREGGPCVYVSQALLDQLERDKRGLKWQLSRAVKTVESHAAQLAACETKVKDLMTIVEMNKSVADKAVQRNYSKECVLQRLHQERVQLQTRVETQQRRALAAFHERRAVETQRDAFQIWSHEATTRRRRRVTIERVARHRRRRRLEQSWQQWRRVIASAVPCHPSLSSVYPLPPPTHYGVVSYVVPDKQSRPTVHFAFSPGSSFSSDSSKASTLQLPPSDRHADNSHKTLSFSTWKAQWLARRRRRQTAVHFARLMLAKRVLLAWKQVIRRRNWQDAMVASARQRRRYTCFGVWAARTARRRKLRVLLARLAARLARRALFCAFVRLRVKCLEKRMAEWGGVLKDARRAMDEERKIYALHQSEALLDLQREAAQQRHTQSLFVDAQLHALARKRHRQLLLRCLASWRLSVATRAMRSRLADQFHQLHRRRRLVRCSFSAWKTRNQQQKTVSKFTQTLRLRRSRALQSAAFRAFTETATRLASQRRSLWRILTRRLRAARLRCLWRWRAATSAANEQAATVLQQREHATRLEIRESAWHGETHRLRRVAYKYQWQCALSLGDAKRAARVRRVLVAWKARVAFVAKRKAALRRTLKRKAARAAGLAVDAWRAMAENHSVFIERLHQHASARKRRLLRSTLLAWRAASQRQVVAAARQGLQFFTLLLWRKRSDQQRARRAALRLLLKLHARHRWQRPAFAKWRWRTEMDVRVETRRRERRQELLQRVWSRWMAHAMRALRRRKRQSDAIASRAESEATRRLVVAVLSAWRGAARQQRTVARSSALCGGLQLRRSRRRAMQHVWTAWTAAARRCVQHKTALRRLASRRNNRLEAGAWRRWCLLVASGHAERRGEAIARRRVQRIVGAQQQRRVLRRLLVSWRAHTRAGKQQRRLLARRLETKRRAMLARCFTQWRLAFTPTQRLWRRLLLARLDAKRKSVLRLGLHLWQRHAASLSTLHQQQHAVQRHTQAQTWALAVLRRARTCRDLRTCFAAWRHDVQHRRERRRAIHRVAAAAAARFVRSAWFEWTRVTRLVAALQAVAEPVNKSLLRCAWAQLHAAVETSRAREGAVLRLDAVLTKAWRRGAWAQWKRHDHAQLVALVASAQLASASRLKAVLDRLGCRHFARSLCARVFGEWQSHARHQRGLRRHVVQILTKQDALSVRRCFHAWTHHLQSQRRGRDAVARLLARRTQLHQRDALAAWRVFSVRASLTAQLEETQRRLRQQREALARRVALVLFSNWQKPTLTAVLRGWKACVDARKQAAGAMRRRQNARRVEAAWAAWRDDMARSQEVSAALTKLLVRERRRQTRLAWTAWHERTLRLDAVEYAVGRLANGLRLRRLRDAWRALRVHQETVMRRQSMMVVVSAQQQLHRHRQLHRLRAAAALMQRQHANRVRETFLLWRSFTETRRQRKAMATAVARRLTRRRCRSVLLAWRRTVTQQHVQRRRVGVWRTSVVPRRLVRSAWLCWLAWVARCRHARRLLHDVCANRAAHSLFAAWTTWTREVAASIDAERTHAETQWHRATLVQQTRVASLEAETERLLLESVELKQAMATQRQRCAEAFARTTTSVVAKAETRKLAAAWTQWALVVRRVDAAEWLVRRLETSLALEAFALWKRETVFRAWAQHENALLERVAGVLRAASTQTRKKTAMAQWKAFVKWRRGKRTRQRVAEMLRRRTRGYGEATVVRCVFASWRAVAMDGRRRVAVVSLMERALYQRELRRAMHAWLQWRDRAQSKREAVLVIWRIARAVGRRRVMQSWLQWRHHTADTTLVLARTRVVLMELDVALLVRLVTAWRQFTSQQRLHDEAVVGRSLAHRCQWLARRVLCAWWRAAARGKARKRQHRLPVLCIRVPLATQRRRKSAVVVRFSEYVHSRERLRPRVALMRRVSRRRLTQAFALAWLARTLRRVRRRRLKRALYTWLAAVQRISSALLAVDFSALPWRRADADVAGSMLLLVLEEMDLARQTHGSELAQRAWTVVDAIARGRLRVAARRAFDKWRCASHSRWPRKPQTASAVAVAARPAATAATTARARALLAVLERVPLRRAFAAWKSQFVALAMRRAQAEYEALQRALAETARRRHAMDAQW